MISIPVADQDKYVHIGRMIPPAITRPAHRDLEELQSLFTQTIRDAFRREGIEQSHAADLDSEIAAQLALVKRDLASGGTEEYFLVARSGDIIVGTAAAGPANDIIRAHAKFDTGGTLEIKSVYVRPDWQGEGIGSRLFEAIRAYLASTGHAHFCLDTGYTQARQYWTRKFGPPATIAKNYWGDGVDHCIWYLDINARSKR